MPDSALVLGSTGRFGRHMTHALKMSGWTVTTFDRSRDCLDQAAEGADVIVNGWNPPYTAWASDVPSMTRHVIAAARQAGATIILPGNVYVYGEGSPSVLRSDTPHAATNPLGRIRLEMEAEYRASGVQTILLRGGDFIDTRASGNWFDKVIVAKAATGRIVAPGDPNAAHAWAYLPDMARAAVALAEQRGKLATFEDIPFPGFSFSVTELAGFIAAATGTTQNVKTLNWLPLYAAAPFWPMGRKLIEMRYLWSMPHQLDGTRLAQVVPGFRPTEISVAMRRAVAHLDIHPNQPMARSQRHIAAK